MAVAIQTQTEKGFVLMIFYVAGIGHPIEKTTFVKQIDGLLLSYYFIIDNGSLVNRFEYLKSIKEQNNDEDQKDGSNKLTRKRKKRTRRKRNS